MGVKLARNGVTTLAASAPEPVPDTASFRIFFGEAQHKIALCNRSEIDHVPQTGELLNPLTARPLASFSRSHRFAD
jgi:hypothetical protein